MTTYSLPDDLSFCRVDGRVIFLDTVSDRYFRLSDRMEHLFIEHIDGAHHSFDDLAPLIDRSILTPSPPHVARVSIEIASRSALESAHPQTSVGIGTVAEALATVCWVQLQLKTRKLKAILDHVIEFRNRRSAGACRESEPRVMNEALAFLRARKFVPIETCCLLDSLSIATFLARRYLPSNIVIGVTSDPFSAHCWVQSGSIVLNDTIGHIRAYTVIRVI